MIPSYLKYIKTKKDHSGSILISLIVTMVILSALGAAMLSLFGSSSMSSVTSSVAREALYMAESGMRYALSELKSSYFSEGVISTLNGTTKYTVDGAGSFKINVFGPWFESSSNYPILVGQTLLTLNVPEGEIPDNFSIPGGILVVNFESFSDIFFDLGGIPDTNDVAVVQSFSKDTETSLTLQLQDDFIADQDDMVCMAVHPSSAQHVVKAEDNDLEISVGARHIFPRRNGAIYIKGMNYFYDERIDDIPGYKVRLTNLSEPSAAAGFTSGFSFDVGPSDYVVLSARNHTIITTGTPAEESSEVSKGLAMNFYDASRPKAGESSPDFSPQEVVESFATPLESIPGSPVIVVEAGTIELGGDVGSAFGAVWFGGNNNIGGIAGFCTDGKCQFNYGVRTFFKLDYDGDGDGFTLAFINGADNDKSSVGGDAGAGELLAYAGDSRTSTNDFDRVTGVDFLDGVREGKGLMSPKMALEFDTYTNAGDGPLCSEWTGFFQGGQRNDPTPSDKDFLQYVFWGSDEPFNCRTNSAGEGSPTYDDNRHDAISGDNPQNIKSKYCTYENLTADGIDDIVVDSKIDWLNGTSTTTKGPWAVRVEVIRSTELNAGLKYEYTLKTWIRQCDDLNCGNIDGTYFADTGVGYEAKTPHLEQTVELSQAEHAKFDTFLFGLTEATGSKVQTATISNLQLSFIKPGDAVINSDPSWP